MRTIKADLVEGADMLGLLLRISEKETGMLDNLTCLLHEVIGPDAMILVS